MKPSSVKNAYHAIQNTQQSTAFSGVLPAVVRSSRSQNLLRYLLGALIGILLSTILFSAKYPQTVASVEKAHAVILSYRNMIKRDNILLDKFFGGEWDRSCGYYMTPEYLLADGTWLSRINKECEK